MTWRHSPDVRGLQVRTRRCPVCLSPPPCLRVSRGGQSRRRRASRRVRSLFRGTWSRASSLGKLDPGPYRRVSEPRAWRVAPAASMSGWRQRQCPWGGGPGPPLWPLWVAGQAVGSAVLAGGGAPCVEGRRGPGLARQALGALGALLQVCAGAPGSSMLSTPRSRRCGRPPTPDPRRLWRQGSCYRGMSGHLSACSDFPTCPRSYRQEKETSKMPCLHDQEAWWAVLMRTLPSVLIPCSPILGGDGLNPHHLGLPISEAGG